MSKKANLYIGRAGQMAVMAEFLIRGYNVAIPEVDVGDDIFVFKDSDGEYVRIQVKTASAVPGQKGYSVRYSLRLSQLTEPTVPEIWYVFAHRLSSNWGSYILIPRNTLFEFYDRHNMGSLNKNGFLQLYFSFWGNKVTCSGMDWSAFINDWSAWPQIEH